MRIAVIGAGGVGGYYGARWLEAGNAVTFVARGAHLQALREHGMRVDHPDFRRDGPVACADMDGLCQGHPADFDVIVLTVKSAATREVAKQLDAWFRSRGHRVPVMSMQNGVDNEGELADVLGAESVIGGFALRVATHVEAPGHITATGPGQVVTGLWPNRAAAAPGPAAEVFPELVRTFDAGGTPVIGTDDIRRELWRKLVINNGLNPVSALTGWDAERLSRNADTVALIRRLMRETAAVARADQIALNDADIDEMFQIVHDLGPIKTSMLVDREQGRPLELDAICGAVLARARRLGEDAPATEVMAGLLRNGLWHSPG